jgi:hypothetical protein
MKLRSLLRWTVAGALGVGPLLAAPATALDPDWVERWASPDVRRESGADVVTDGEGNLYVCATSGFAQLETSDVLVLSYSPAGARRWSDVYDSGGQDLAVALEIDPTGRLIVAGRSLGDFLVLAYDPATGARLGAWTHDPGGIDDPRALATDADGHIYLTGSSWTDEQNDYYTIELDADGNLVWSARYQGPGAFLFAHDVAYDVAVDAAGDVFVTGSSNGPGQPSGDFVTIKYSGVDGSELWFDRYSAGSNEVAYDLELDAGGDVYIAGGSYQSGFVYVVRKYANATGAVLWSVTHQPELCSVATELELDGANGVYVSGWADPDCDESNFNDNIVTDRFAADSGALLWSTSFGSPAVGQYDVPSDLGVDGFGRPWVTGVNVAVLVVLRYDPASGAIVDQGTVAGGPEELSGGSALAFIDGLDLAVTGGYRNFNTENRDVLTLRMPGSDPTLLVDGFESGDTGGWSLVVD